MWWGGVGGVGHMRTHISKQMIAFGEDKVG